MMVRFVRLLAAAAFAAGLAAAPQAASAQSGAPESSQATPHKSKPRQTTMRKRAKHPAPAGRQVTVHARSRPSYLTAGTQVPVGTVGNGYAVDTFSQPTPISGTFMGMRGQERITDRFGNAGPGLTLFRF